MPILYFTCIVPTTFRAELVVESVFMKLPVVVPLTMYVQQGLQYRRPALQT